MLSNRMTLLRTLLIALLPLPALADGHLQPSEDQKALIETLSAEVLKAYGERDHDAVYAMFSDALYAMISYSDYVANHNETTDLIGPMRGWQLLAVTWYPRDQLFAAVDYIGQAEAPGIFECGYLVWQFETETTFGILRMERNVVDLSLLEGRPPMEIAQVLKEFSCHDTAVQFFLNQLSVGSGS